MLIRRNLMIIAVGKTFKGHAFRRWTRITPDRIGRIIISTILYTCRWYLSMITRIIIWIIRVCRRGRHSRGHIICSRRMEMISSGRILSGQRRMTWWNVVIVASEAASASSISSHWVLVQWIDWHRFARRGRIRPSVSGAAGHARIWGHWRAKIFHGHGILPRERSGTPGTIRWPNSGSGSSEPRWVMTLLKKRTENSLN